MAVRRTSPWSVLRRHASGTVAAVLMVLLVVFGYVESLETWALGRLFQLRGPRPPTTPIVIVTIDESSFSEVDQQWPFPRAMHARLLRRLAAGRPLAIGIDLIFDAPSSRGSADDEALGGAVAYAGNVVLGAGAAIDIQPFYRRETLNIPIPVIREGAAAVAPVNLPPEADGEIRRLPLRLRVGDERLEGFDAALYRVATRAGLRAAPLPAGDYLLINFRGGPRTYPWVPYYRVVNGEIPPAFFHDKIVLVGPTSELLHDLFPTAFAHVGDMPGVEIHADALDTLVHGDPIHEVPRAASAGLAVIAALAGAVLVVRLHAFRALLAAAGAWLLLAVAGWAMFAFGDVWLRGMAPTLALVLGYGATVVDNFVREQREKRRLSQFFSPEVLRAVVRQRGEGGLGSSRRLVTVLFSDIRGFTSISERLEPEQVAEMLREYLTEMTEIVFQHNGTVDKYIGDCVMALYNVPFEDADHAANAVRTGLAFQERTLEVSARWEAKLGISIRNGVGIHTGEAVVGTMGSRQRLEYTAIGDTVNLASRLESITKDYKTAIIISESTYEAVKGRFVTRELGEVTVKGKTQPVKIYTVLAGDLRKHPRATLEAAATLVLTGAGQVVTVHTRDISESGIALAGVPESLAPGARVQIRCEGGLLPKPIIAEGTVAWRRGDQAGIAFTTLAPESASAVAAYVARRG